MATNKLNPDIWQITTPPKAAKILLSVYGIKAISVAFQREAKSWQKNNNNDAHFWNHVQHILISSIPREDN